MRAFTVPGPETGESAGKDAFFARQIDAERYAAHVRREVAVCDVVTPDGIAWLTGPRHVADALVWFLKVGAMVEADLTDEDKSALQRAFGAASCG